MSATNRFVCFTSETKAIPVFGLTSTFELRCCCAFDIFSTILFLSPVSISRERNGRRPMTIQPSLNFSGRFQREFSFSVDNDSNISVNAHYSSNAPSTKRPFDPLSKLLKFQRWHLLWHQPKRQPWHLNLSDNNRHRHPLLLNKSTEPKTTKLPPLFHSNRTPRWCPIQPPWV